MPVCKGHLDKMSSKGKRSSRASDVKPKLLIYWKIFKSTAQYLQSVNISASTFACQCMVNRSIRFDVGKLCADLCRCSALCGNNIATLHSQVVAT